MIVPAELQSNSPADKLLAFCEVLRRYGISTPPSKLLDALSCIESVGFDARDNFRFALRTALISRVEDLNLFDRIFSVFWMGTGDADEEDSLSPETQQEEGGGPAMVETQSEDEQTGAEPRRLVSVYSPVKANREQDIKDWDENDETRFEALVREIVRPLFRRYGVRRQQGSGAGPEFRKLFRRSLTYGGEIVELPQKRIRKRLKKIVILCDVSGSMGPYQHFMLRFARELRRLPTPVEVFVFSTRLTRVSRILDLRPFSAVMREIGRIAEDWSGGTRIGECLDQCTQFGAGGLLRYSTVFIIHSDGWDRGALDVLENAMRLIHRRVYSLIWMNPLMGAPGYEPTCRGMRAALPYIDRFISGRSLSGYETAAGTIMSMLA